MIRFAVVALVLAGCNSGKGSGVDGDDSGVKWPYTSGTATATGGGPGGTGTGTGTATGGGPGGTGTGTGVATGTGTGTTGSGGTGTGATGTATGGGPGGTGTGTGGPTGCVASIPANAIVVDTDRVETNPGVYWVCGHDNLSLTADNSIVYIDDQGDAVVNGSNNVIYMTSRADLAIFDSGNEVFPETGAAINDQNPPNTIHTCASFTWDISNAPTPGC